MSLFVCEDCGVVENTATSRFWFRTKENALKALCSQCDPTIGKWHGLFPRAKYDPRVHKPAFMDGNWTDSDEKSLG